MADEKPAEAGADAPAAEPKIADQIIDLDAVQAEKPAAGEQEAVEPKDKAKADDSPSEEQAEGSEDDDEGEAPARKKRSGTQRLKSQLAAAQARIEALERIAPKQDDATVLQGLIDQKVGAPPKESDFANDYLAYERAQLRYEIKRDNAEERIKDDIAHARNDANAANEEISESFRERVAAARGRIKDFDDVTQKATVSPGHPDVIRAIISSEKSPELAYHLSKNPELVHKLNSMPPFAAIREIGKLEASLSLATPKTVTKAPAPVEPLKGGSSPKSKSPADMSPREYNAYMDAKEKRARQG